MHPLQIPNFPTASFDKNKSIGWLHSYYPYTYVSSGSITYNKWRDTGSNNILDYKEGHDDHISFYVDPFLVLVEYVLKFLNFNNGYLVPTPSSKSFNDPNFNHEYIGKKDSERINRDNRNDIFCKKLSEKSNKILYKNIVRRKEGKEEKINKSSDWHKESFEIDQSIKFESNFSDLIIIVDDIITTGDTTQGLLDFLKEEIPNASYVRLFLGKTTSD